LILALNLVLYRKDYYFYYSCVHSYTTSTASTRTTAVVVSGYHGMRAPTKFSTGTFVRRGMVVGMVVGMTTRIPRYSCTTRESEE
jgi:cytochrome bd-type quinol oxidase subunit 1